MIGQKIEILLRQDSQYSRVPDVLHFLLLTHFLKQFMINITHIVKPLRANPKTEAYQRMLYYQSPNN